MKFKIDQETLEDILSRIGDEVLSSIACDFSARTDYSGRGMYGNTCIGFVIDANPIYLAMGIGSILRDMENNEELVDVDGNYFGWYDLRVETDSMGLSSILYFPNLSIAD